MKIVLGLLAVTLLAGGGVAYWLLHEAGGSTSSFRTVAVERGDLQATISATGTLEPEDVIDVGAQVVGKIKKFGLDLDDSSRPIDYGSRVEVDTVLAYIDDEKYEARVVQAGANVLVAGSAIFRGGNYKASIAAIRHAASLARGEAA